MGAAERIVDRLIDAMGDNAADHLSAFLERCGQRLAAQVATTLRQSNSAQVDYDDTVELVALAKTRESRRPEVVGHADGSFERLRPHNGWDKHLYSHAWFHTAPEFLVANAIDRAESVLVWARLHYNPDFVVLEEINDKRYGWLVETKADKDMTSEEVKGKRKAARRWTNTANSAAEVATTWNYLLVGETDIAQAAGTWEHLKGFGR